MNSNEGYGFDEGVAQELEQLYDSTRSIPDDLAELKPGVRRYLETHHLAPADLRRIGARLKAHGHDLAYFYAGGVRFKSTVSGAVWAWTGSDFGTPKVIPSRLNGSRPDAAVVVEGEPDAARMASEDGPGMDVVCMAGGAARISPALIEELSGYGVIYTGQDADKAGDKSAAALEAALDGKTVIRWRPPEGQDWCDLDTIPKPPAPPAAWERLLTRAADVSMRRQRYLWEGRIPLGELVAMYGTEGLGKGATWVRLAAELTRGTLPGAYEGTPRSVVIFSPEDSHDTVLVPRLKAAGADLEQIYLLGTDTGIALPRDLKKFEAALDGLDPGLVILDPGSAILDPGVDRWHNQQIKQALFPLRDLCDRMLLSILAVLHTNRQTGNDPRARGAEALAWRQVCRTALTFGLDPDDADARGSARMLALSKMNLGKLDTPSIKIALESVDVDIEGEPQSVVCARFGAESQYSAAQVLAAEAEDKQAPQRDRAKDLIEQELGSGPRTAEHMREFLERHGISPRTARRVPGVQRGQHRRTWYWWLPGHAPDWHVPERDEATEEVPI